MRIRKPLFLAVFLVALALVFSLSSVAVAAPQVCEIGNVPSPSVTVVAHYAQVDMVFSGVEGDTKESGFIYEGLHWSNPSIAYYVNLGGRSSAFLTGVVHSFNSWNEVSTRLQATCKGTTRSVPGSLQAKWNRSTGGYSGGLNVVGWRNLDAQYPGAIGVTYIWSYQNSLIEVDTALNSSSQFRWWQTEVSGDPDAAKWPASQITAAYDVDVQNIMTHEAGHWLVLSDLYDGSVDSNQTMYGYAGQNELKKRSLEDGDIAGIRAIYGT